MNDDSIPKCSHHTISHGFKDKRREDISALPLLQQKYYNFNAYDLSNTTYQLKVGKKMLGLGCYDLSLCYSL